MPVYILLLLMLASMYAQAQELTSNLPTDSTFVKGTLPNGLTFYVRHNSHPDNRVELRLVVKAGSILEDDDQQGVAHFLEHLNFNGTLNYKKNELVSYLQTLGMQFGADVNASTGFNETIYKLSLPVEDIGNLEKGFLVLSDWAHNALLTDADIDAERGVVLEESRLRKGVSQRARDQYLPELLSGSRYAKRLPIGKDSIIRNFRYEVVRRFYHDWYRPDLMAVVVVGDMDTAVAVNMLRKYFAPLTNPTNERPHFDADVKRRSEPGAIVIKDSEAPGGQVSIIYPFTKKNAMVTTGDYMNELRSSMVISILNQRFSDRIHNGGSSSHSKFISFNTTVQGYHAFEASASFLNEYGPGQGIRFLTRELARARNHLFNQSELDFTRRKFFSKAESAYAERDNEKSVTLAARYVSNFTDGNYLAGIAEHYNLMQQLLPKVQLGELDTMMKEWLNSTDFFVVAIAPDKPSAWPSGNDVVLKITQDGFYQHTEPLEDDEVDTAIMDEQPRAGTVTGRAYDADLDATTYTLSNGIKVTVKNTALKNDEVLLTGLKAGGNNNYTAEDKNNYTYLGSVTEAMGFGDYKPDEIYKITADKNIKVSTSLGNVTATVNGRSDRKDVAQMLQLVYLRLTSPRRDPNAFKLFIKKGTKGIKDIYSDPQLYFKDTVAKMLYGDNPLATGLPKESDLEGIDLKRVLKIYKSEFSYADGYHFFIVGNIDTNTIVPLIGTYLGGLRESGILPHIKDNGLRPVGGTRRITVRKGKEQKSTILAEYYGPVTYTEKLSQDANVLIDILNIKVTEHLREAMGMIYTGGFSLSIKKIPYEHYRIDLHLPCGPDNVDKLIAAVKNEINAIKDNGPTAEDLQKVKNHLLEVHKTKLKENSYWMTSLENIFFWHRDRTILLNYESRLNSVTIADVQATSKLLFDGKNEFIAVLMPE